MPLWQLSPACAEKFLASLADKGIDWVSDEVESLMASGVSKLMYSITGVPPIKG